MKLILLLFLICNSLNLYSQVSIKGTIFDEKNSPLSGVSISLSKSSQKFFSNKKGQFEIHSGQHFPIQITFEKINHVTEKIIYTNEKDHGIIILNSLNTLDEIIIAASKKKQNIKDSPISIEKFGLNTIENTSSYNYYSELENLKGVDINTNSLTFKTVNTRGYSTFANERFVQLTDGVDNSSPALNFVIGEFLAPDELDVNSIELIPGATSALYGANAFNGLLSISTKSPFLYTGVSSYLKTGLTSSRNSGSNNFTDLGVRLAKKLNDKIALKASFSFLKGKDWVARDYRDNNNPSFSRTDPSFDGLNIYGDEVSTTLNFDEIAQVPQGTFGTSRVSRTGYEEEFLIDNDISNIKSNIALHLKPFKNDLEIILNSKIGIGNTTHHSSNRFSFKDFIIQHHKIEIKNNNFFLRGYLTAESAGNSYDSRFTAININRLWKSDTQWFTDYTTGYLGAITGQIPNVAAGNPETAHAIARSLADQGRITPNTQQFDDAFKRVTSDANLLSGSKFIDRSKLYHVDGNYNFENLKEILDIQIGGSFRKYILDSDGTIFTDNTGTIDYDEFGGYLQLDKKLFNNQLKIGGSLRYDKSQNFDGNLSPRLFIVQALDKEKNHNLRASFQQAFRNPTTQDQYIGLDIGNAILVGSAPENLDRFISRPIDLSTNARNLGFGDTVQLTGRNAYENAFTLDSFENFVAAANNGTPDPSILKISNVDLVKPERISTFEIGYRGSLKKKIHIDTYIYYNEYRDFIRQNTVITPVYGNVDFSDINRTLSQANALIAIANSDVRPFQVFTNSASKISSFGGAIGLDTELFDLLNLQINYTYAEQNVKADDLSFQSRFNTPKHKVKLAIGNRELFSRTGFKLNWRWNDNYLWESDFATRNLPAMSLFDLQIKHVIPKWKSSIKLGTVNLFNKEYVSAPGASLIGSQYYFSWVMNI